MGAGAVPVPGVKGIAVAAFVTVLQAGAAAASADGVGHPPPSAGLDDGEPPQPAQTATPIATLRMKNAFMAT
jgi:hypothetical protein